jgi:hypothetical protein
LQLDFRSTIKQEFTIEFAPVSRALVSDVARGWTAASCFRNALPPLTSSIFLQFTSEPLLVSFRHLDIVGCDKMTATGALKSIQIGPPDPLESHLAQADGVDELHNSHAAFFSLDDV